MLSTIMSETTSADSASSIFYSATKFVKTVSVSWTVVYLFNFVSPIWIIFVGPLQCIRMSWHTSVFRFVVKQLKEDVFYLNSTRGNLYQCVCPRRISLNFTKHLRCASNGHLMTLCYTTFNCYFSLRKDAMFSNATNNYVQFLQYLLCKIR